MIVKLILKKNKVVIESNDDNDNFHDGENNDDFNLEEKDFSFSFTNMYDVVSCVRMLFD